MASNFFGPTPGGGGSSSVTVSNFPSPQLININQATPGTTNGVIVNNTSSSPIPVNVNYSGATPGKVQLVDSSGNPISDSSWSGALSSIKAATLQEAAGAIINRVVEAISSSVADSTLSRPSGCSNFLSCAVFNPTGSDCTYTIGNANATTGTCKANSSVQFDCNVTKLVLHATVAGQQINGFVYDPTVT